MEVPKEQRSHHVSSPVYPFDPGLKDEVNLIDLWCVLVRQWRVISAITILSILGAVAYVILATPVYEAQAIVSPPEEKYVKALNISGVSKVSSADIFAKFTGNLKNTSLRKQFVDENPQFSSLRWAVPNIKEGVREQAGSVLVSLQGYDSKLVADWVDGFIQLAQIKTIGDFFDEIEININDQKKQIQDQLQIGRDTSDQRRLDRIALLEEQIAIARAAKILDRQVSGYSTVVEEQRFGVTFETLKGPMYMRGVKELTAEKEVLEKRKNNEPFIADFRDKQERLVQLDAVLEQCREAKANVHAVTVGQSAIQSENPVKPKRKMVLALSVVLGFMLGISTAFVVDAVERKKKMGKGKGGDVMTGSS